MAYLIFNNSTNVESALKHLETVSLDLAQHIGEGLNIKINVINNENVKNCVIKFDDFKVFSSKG